MERSGTLELWHNTQTDVYGVYLYEHEQIDESWLMWQSRRSYEAARQTFDKVRNLIE